MAWISTNIIWIAGFAGGSLGHRAILPAPEASLDSHPPSSGEEAEVKTWPNTEPGAEPGWTKNSALPTLAEAAMFVLDPQNGGVGATMVIFILALSEFAVCLRSSKDVSHPTRSVLQGQELISLSTS